MILITGMFSAGSHLIRIPLRKSKATIYITDRLGSGERTEETLWSSACEGVFGDAAEPISERSGGLKDKGDF